MSYDMIATGNRWWNKASPIVKKDYGQECFYIKFKQKSKNNCVTKFFEHFPCIFLCTKLNPFPQLCLWFKRTSFLVILPHKSYKYARVFFLLDLYKLWGKNLISVECTLPPWSVFVKTLIYNSWECFNFTGLMVF